MHFMNADVSFEIKFKHQIAAELHFDLAKTFKPLQCYCIIRVHEMDVRVQFQNH